MKKNLILAMCGAAMMLIPAVACQRNSDNAKDSDSVAVMDSAAVEDSAQTAATDSLADLFKDGVGKYPRDIKLMENADLKSRLVALLGQERYDFLAANFNVESPIEDKDGVYTAYACQQNNCSDTNFTISYDSKTNLLNVIYRVDGKDQTFAEE